MIVYVWYNTTALFTSSVPWDGPHHHMVCGLVWHNNTLIVNIKLNVGVVIVELHEYGRHKQTMQHLNTDFLTSCNLWLYSLKLCYKGLLIWYIRVLAIRLHLGFHSEAHLSTRWCTVVDHEIQFFSAKRHTYQRCTWLLISMIGSCIDKIASYHPHHHYYCGF